MLRKSTLLAGVSPIFTANERRLGRMIRDGEGHPAPAPTPEPTPEPTPTPAPAPGEEDDFSAFEQNMEPKDDNDDDSSGDNVDPAPSDDDDADDGAPDPDDQQGASDVQKRIDELTAKQREAEREAAELRRKLDEYEKANKSDDKDQPKERNPDERPNPNDYEFGEADSKYIEDLAEWKADMRWNERERQKALDTQVQEIEDGWTKKVNSDETKAKYADFDEKVTKGADRGDWDLSPIGVVLVKASPVSDDVAYHLATNPEESRRIAQLNPIEQAQEFGRLEGRFMNSGGSTPAPKVASDAPPPPSNRSRGAGGKFQTSPDTDDFGAFDKYADGVLAKN